MRLNQQQQITLKAMMLRCGRQELETRCDCLYPTIERAASGADLWLGDQENIAHAIEQWDAGNNVDPREEDQDVY